MKQDKLLFYAIGLLVLIAVIGYFLADASWDVVMDTLTATETPTPSPTTTPIAETPQASTLSKLSAHKSP